MKIFVFSDSHHSIGNMYNAVEQAQPELILHLGDCVDDAEDLYAAFPEIELLQVPGNCDFGVQLQPSLLLERQNVRIFMTHGHLYGVKSGLERLVAEGKSLQANIVLFGHTHQAVCRQQDGMWLLNPGTCTSYGRASYGCILLEGGASTCSIENF